MAKPALFSRSGNTCVIGKKTVPRHTKIPGETDDILVRLALEADMTISEFICEVLMVRAHGEETIASLHARRLSVVSGKAPQKHSS